MNTYAQAEKIIKKEGVGVFPTDTLYGVVGSAFSRKAVARIYKLRKRNPKKPLIILIHALADIDLFGITPDLKDKKILRTLWPGKVSVIVPCKPSNTTLTGSAKTAGVKVDILGKRKKFAYLHRGTDALAFRVPASSALRRLLKKTGPLVAPSANLEGEPPAKTVAEAEKYFGDTVDFYVDRGRLTSQPSTLITLENGRISVVRKGAFKPLKRMVN